MVDTVSDLSLSDLIAPKANPFADAVAGVLKQEGQDTAAQIRSNVQFAVGTNPDQEAGFKHLASYVGVPVDTVRAQPEAIKQQAAMQSMDAGKIVSDFPHLARFLTDPNNARIIHDDIPGTASVEQATKALTPPLDDYPSMTEWNPSLGQRARMWLDKLFTPGVNALIGNAPEPQKQFVSGLLNTGSFGIVPDVAGEATTGAGAIGKGAGSLTGFVLGGPIKAADYIGERLGVKALDHIAGESFAKALAKDITVGAAKLGTASALAHVGTGIDSPDVATFLAQEGKAAGSGAAMGGIFGAAGRLLPDSAIAQTLGRVVGVNAALDASQGKTPFEDLANWDKLTGAQQADAVFNYGLNTLFSLRGAGRTTGGWWNDAAKADIAAEDMTKLQQLGQVAAASKLRERDPAAFKQFIENVTEDGHLSEVYIDARALGDVLNQAGVTPDKFVEQMPEVAAQMHEALQTGGDVRISVADYATHVAGGPVDAGILPHLKTDPDGKTYAQAQEFYQGQRAQLQEEAGKIIAQRAEDEAYKADHQQVFDQVLGQLNDANRFTPDVNKAYATLARDFYVTTADKLGVKPTELMDRYPLKVAVERMTEDGKHFDQAARAVEQVLGAATEKGTKQGKAVLGDVSPWLAAVAKEHGLDIEGYKHSLDTSAVRHIRNRHGNEKVEASRNQLPITDDDLRAVPRLLAHPDAAIFGLKTRNGLDMVVLQKALPDGNVLYLEEVRNGKGELSAVSMRKHPATMSAADAIATLDPNARSDGGAGISVVDAPGEYNQASKADTRELLVQHNLTSDNLLHAVKMGGIPVPSLAITKAAHPLTGFGDITLLGSKEMADPKGYAKTKVFGADIYSPRYPTVHFKVDAKGQKALDAKLAPFNDLTGERHFDLDDLQKNGVRYLEEDARVMAAFLDSKGIKVETVRKAPTELPDALKPFAGDTRFSHELAADPDFIKAVYQAHEDNLVKANGEDYRDSAKDEIAQLKANGEARGANYLVRGAANDVARYQRDLRDAGAVDKVSTKNVLRNAIEQNDLGRELQGYAKNLLESLEPSERIFKGYNSQGGYSYTPHTLENVVKILKKELVGGENFNYGVGSIRAKFTPQFRSIEQIRNAKDRLMGKAEFEAVKDEIDNDFFAVSEQLAPHHPIGGEFRFTDTMTSMMYDAASMGVPRALKENGFTDVPVEQQKAVAEFLTKLRTLPTEYFEAKILRDVDLAEFSGAVVPEGVDPKVIEALQARGVKDIRTYTKGDEADRTAKIGEFEHLLFQGNRGAYNPETGTIALLKGADLSTFLHETGHHFLEMTADLASRADAPEAIRADFGKLLDWFGVKDAAEWHNLSFEEKRSYHEQFARGFEAYLLEGKAPSVELAGLFSRFRSWLLNVYKSITGLNVELTPEVRGVFDRMLASEDAIKNAEQVRGYEPMFKSATDAGMTPEQWADYQKLGAEATENAIDDMEKRSLRDMRWLSNAKAGALKDLQREAASKRREVRTEVSKEVWSQPVYQAWQFLTSKENLEPVKAAPKAKASKGVDEGRDSLLTAIAKLGGIERDKASVDLGIHKDDYQAKAKNGRLLFREGKGMTPDRMAEALMEHGYLERDANDRWSLRELEEKLQDEIGGRKHYSSNADYDYLVGNGVTVENLQQRNGGRLDAAKVMGHGAEGLKVEALKMTKRDGLDPDLVAEMHGFTDGDELIRALAEAQHPKDVIEGMTDQRMLEKYGELSDPQSIERAAEAAIHNEARARFVATELKALTKATGPAKALAEAAKEAAEAAIAAKRVRDLRPAQYTAAEARASRNADKALLGQDIVAAANEKRAQLLNNRLAKAADNAIEDVRKGVDYLKKFDKAGVRENIELEYRDQIDALLDRYDLRKGTSGKALDRREALLQFVERMASEGYEPNVPEHLLDEAKRQHYKELTVEQFRGLVDAVKSIEHLGRLKTRLMDGQEAREIKLLAEEATTTMAELPQRDPESNRGLTRMESAWLSVKSAGRSAQAALLKMEQMFDWLDKRNSEGVFNRVVFRRIADAGVRENDMLGRVKAEIDKLLDTNLADVTKEKGKIYTANGLIDGLTGNAQRFTKKQMLMLAGNMGNESNVAKLIAGEKWNEQAVWDFLHANMTKADWDFVAGMGKTLETLWPEKLAMSRRLGNTNPEKIAPRPFDTQHGRYEGWYWPMMYDPARAQDVAERGAKKADALFENIYTRANTDTGRMNTRNANYAKPLLLDLDALPRVIRDEIHDIAFREAVLDADKFLSDGRVRQGIIDAMSQEHYDQLRPWLQSIANDGKLDDTGMRALKWFNDLARGARTRATMVGLGYRLSTMIVHGTSAGLESVAELGPRWFASGLRDFSNPAQWAANKDFIFERSGEMRNRMNEVDRDVREHLRQIDLELMDPTTGTVARGLDAFKAHAYQGIAMLDMASALPTWMGAYHKAMAPEAKGGLGMGEKDAIYFADKTIRNAHGGTGVKDLAAVQRGPEFFKLFTMFYTFWNHNVNRIMDTYRMGKELPATYAEGREAGDMAKFKGDLSSVLMRTLIYTFGVQIMHGMLHPPKDEDKDEAWLKWAGKEVLSAAFAGIPIARDLSAHFIQGKDYSVTPAASMVDAFDRSGKDAIDAMSGNTVSDKWLKHSITTAGYVFGLPTGQPASAVQFLWDVADAKQNPQELADWWRGILHGDMTKH